MMGLGQVTARDCAIAFSVVVLLASTLGGALASAERCETPSYTVLFAADSEYVEDIVISRVDVVREPITNVPIAQDRVRLTVVYADVDPPATWPQTIEVYDQDGSLEYRVPTSPGVSWDFGSYTTGTYTVQIRTGNTYLETFTFRIAQGSDDDTITPKEWRGCA